MKKNLKILSLLFILVAEIIFGQTIIEYNNIQFSDPDNNNYGNFVNHPKYKKIKFQISKIRNTTPQNYTIRVRSEYNFDTYMKIIVSDNLNTLKEWVNCEKTGNCVGEFNKSSSQITAFDNHIKSGSATFYTSDFEKGDSYAAYITGNEFIYKTNPSKLFVLFWMIKPENFYSKNFVKDDFGGKCDFCNFNKDAITPREYNEALTNYYIECENSGGFNRNGATQRQQEIAQATEQLGTAVEGIFNTIQKNQEKKRQREAEEKRKNEELHANANNGDFDALYKLAEKALLDVNNDEALKYAKSALENSNGASSFEKEKLENIIKFSLDPIKGMEYKTYQLLLNDYKSSIVYDYSKRYFTNLIAFGDDYFTKPILTDELKTEAVNNIIKHHGLENAFFQITGKFENFGIKKDVQTGFNFLKKFADKKESLAYYYLGLVYEKGYLDGKINLDKAERYYKDALFNGNCRISKSSSLIYIPAKSSLTSSGSDYFNQFNECILSYIGLMRIYSQSNNNSDKKLVATMKRKFINEYGNLLSNSDRELFGLPKKVSPFLIFSDYEFFDLESNTPVILNSLMRKDKKTIIVTWSKEWCKPCLDDIDALLKRGMDKKYNMIIINVDMKSKDSPSYQAILDHSKLFLYSYFKNSTMLYDKNSLLTQFDDGAAPFYWIFDVDGRIIRTVLGYGKTDEIK